MVLFYDLSSPTQVLETFIPPVNVSSRETPNRSHPLSALLAVYPFISGLAPYLDHNDLYNLSSTCWQFHENMKQYRKTLLKLSLRCSYDVEEDSTSGAFDWRSFRRGRRCARDLVNPCLGCKKPYCRNDITKPTAAQTTFRLRRLCNTCRTTTTLLSPHQKRCRCIDGSWLCNLCFRVNINQEDIQSIMYWPQIDKSLEPVDVSYFLCHRGSKYCQGKGDGTDGDFRGALVEGYGEGKRGEGRYVDIMRKDEIDGAVRGWCNWCDGVVLSKQEEQDLEKLGYEV